MFASTSNPIQVNTTSSGTQSNPSILALADNNFLTAWIDIFDGKRKAQLLDPYGAKLGNEYTLGEQTAGGLYLLQLQNGNIAVLGDDGSAITGDVLSSAGSPLTTSLELLPNAGSYPYFAALAGGGFAVAAHTSSQTGAQVRGFDATGNPVGPSASYDITGTSESIVKEVSALADGGYLLTWGSSLSAQKFYADGTLNGGVYTVSPSVSVSYHANVDIERLPDGRLLAVWGQGEIFGQFVDSSGTPYGATIQLNANTAGTQQYPKIAVLATGNIAIAWYSDNTVTARIFSGEGNALSPDLTLSLAPPGPSVLWLTSTADGGAVVSWRGTDASGEGVRGRYITADGQLGSAELLINTEESGNQYSSALASNSTGTTVFTFTDANGLDGSDSGVFSRAYSSIGNIAVADTILATLADEHFIGTDLANPATPLKRVSYENSTAAVNIDLAANTSAASTASGGVAQGDYFTNINAVTGSSHDDSLTGNGVANLLIGGAGIDTLAGGAGNDTFVVIAGDVVSGDTIDGGADTDTVRVDGGGTVDLTPLSLTSVENITLTNAAGTNVTVTAAQAALISSATGTTDIVNIGGNFNTNTALIKQLLNAGVEQVKWTSSVYGSATAAPDPSDATQFTVTYNDTGLTRPFDYIRTTYDTNGNRVAQTQLFDTGLNNGVLQQQEYDPLTGGLISNVYIDSLGTRTFQSVTTDFTDGIRTHTRTINDNNKGTNADDTIVDQYYDAAGVITLELTTDASPGGTGKPWVSVAREYVGGVTQIFRTTYDNANQQVLGTAGSEEIQGGAGADVLIGGAGADVFVFAPGFGNDTVYDYADGTDRLDFTAFGVDTRAGLETIASITTAGTATLISLYSGGSVKILNLAPSALGDSDFVGIPVAG